VAHRPGLEARPAGSRRLALRGEHRRDAGTNGKPTLLLYRVRPCREFEGSRSGVRTCTRWSPEVNARTKLTCE